MFCLNNDTKRMTWSLVNFFNDYKAKSNSASSQTAANIKTLNYICMYFMDD